MYRTPILSGSDTFTLDGTNFTAQIQVFDLNEHGDYPLKITFYCKEAKDFTTVKNLFEAPRALKFTSSLCASKNIDINYIVMGNIQTSGMTIIADCLSDNPSTLVFG